MKYDLSQSISQRSSREKDEENQRIQKIADELTRRCQLYEAESGIGQSHVTSLETEARITETFAKEYGLWIPMSEVFDLGTPGPSGNENDLYVSNDTIFKVNNLLNSGSIVHFLEKVVLHNTIFPETFYYLIGFAGYEGRSVMPVLKQDLIKDAIPATPVEIDTYMSALGFCKDHPDGRFHNDAYVVWDILPRNVLRDKEGDIYVVDAEIKTLSHKFIS